MYQYEKKAICEFDPPRHSEPWAIVAKKMVACVLFFFALDKQGSKARVDIISGFVLPYTGSGIQTFGRG